VNLAGKSVIVGLTDAHCHLYGLGSDLENVSVRNLASEKDVVATIAAAAKTRPVGEWLVGRGWDQNKWPGQQFPTKASLDAVVSDRPVLLRRIDGHAAWVNSNALAAAGVTKATKDPPGGKIIRDAKGEPTGVLVDNAIVMLENIFRRYQQGESAEEASAKGAGEVWGALLNATLANLAMFIPVLFIKEEAGQLFRDIAIAISAAVALSMLVAVAVVPTAALRSGVFRFVTQACAGETAARNRPSCVDATGAPLVPVSSYSFVANDPRQLGLDPAMRQETLKLLPLRTSHTQ
jgi:hypothetical protein